MDSTIESRRRVRVAGKPSVSPFARAKSKVRPEAELFQDVFGQIGVFPVPVGPIGDVICGPLR